MINLWSPLFSKPAQKKETNQINQIADFVFADYAPTLTSPIFAISKSFVISWIYTLQAVRLEKKNLPFEQTKGKHELMTR